VQLRLNGKKFFVAVALIGASLLMAPSVVAETAISRNSTPAELQAYVKEIDEKIKSQPHVAKYYGFKGQALELLGDNKGAVAAFTRKLELAPADRVGMYRRAENYKQLGSLKEALADYDQLIANGYEKVFVYSGRSLVKTIQKNFSGALSDAEKAVSLDGRNERAWYSKGVAQFYLKVPDRGVASFTEAIRIDPSSKDSWAMRSDAFLALGKRKEAAADIAKAKSLGWKE